MGAIHIVIDDKDYELTAISGDTYTYTAEDNDTATLVISGETLTLNGTPLTSLVVEPVFTEGQAGTYKCDTGTVMSLTFNANGVGVYTFDTWKHNEFDVTITKGDSGSYSFVYNYQGSDRTVTFTFDNDGNIVLTDANVQSNATFVKEAPAVEGTLYSGSYVTIGGDNTELELILSDDLTSGTLSMNDPEDASGNGIAITLTSTGIDDMYSFTNSDGYWAGTITIVGDTVSISIDYMDTYTLTKQS